MENTLRTVDAPKDDVRPQGPLVGGADSTVVTVGKISAVIASWAILRPYLGVVHDAQLYFHFAEFGSLRSFRTLDVAVANDEQMSRSVFVPLLRPLVNAFGLAAAAMITTFVGMVSWVLALVGLGRVLVGRYWWIVAVGVPAFGAYWGPLFLLAEPFSTPRVFAEALVIGAMALVLSNRAVLAVVTAVVAAVLHPIIGLSGLAVVIAVVVIGRRRWAVAVATLAIAAVVFAAWDPIGLAGTDTFNATWLAIVAERASLVLPGEWNVIAWVRTLFAFTIVGSLYLSATTENVRRVALASFIVAGAGLLTSVLFSWAVISPFITQLQPWRVLWILHLMAIIGVLYFSIEAWLRRSPETILRALAAWLMALTVGARGLPLGYVIVFLACLPLMLPIRTAFQRSLTNGRVVRVLAALVALVALVEISGAVLRILLDEDLGRIPWIGFGSQLPALTLMVAAVLVASVVGLRIGGVWRMLGAAILALALVFGVTTWDHRTDWQAYYESVEVAVVHLPEDSLVLVEYDGIATATLLRRPTFYSGYAGAGVVFSETLATTYDHHAVVSRSLGIPFALNYRLGNIEFEDLKEASPAALVAACEDPLGPTHVFLRRPVSGIEGFVWTSPVPIDDVPVGVSNAAVLEDGFVLYDCADITG